jgi:mono/diheme cytochrome c family protein
MPAYNEGVMSDKEIADIYAFVQALPGPRPAKDIPLLNS